MNTDKLFYSIPTQMPEEICDIIFNQYDKREKENSVMGMSENLDFSKRKSQNSWIYNDEWISLILENTVKKVNNTYFKFNLVDWIGSLQFTIYDGENSHYGWHQDFLDFGENQMVRKLSVVLFLSDPKDYEGGEFQIYNYTKQMETIKPERGTIIIFPSYYPHRVRQVKSGKRCTLVGWYGGPRFT